MRLIEVSDKRNSCYVLPLGDLHLGSPQTDLTKFEGYLQWARKEKAHIICMGDLYDTVVIGGVSSPFGASMTLRDAKHYLKDRLRPVKDLIDAMIIGNHEMRLVRFADCDLIEDLCDDLGVPYAGFSAVMRYRVGHNQRRKGEETYDSTRINYTLYCHHTTGGGATPGGKLNRVAKLSEIFEGADALIGAHNHMESGTPIDRYRLHTDSSGQARVKADKVFLVDSGSFLSWDGSYAEEKALPPTHMGCPRIRLDGVRKDIHVSE
jgi:hypothetical protein